MRRRSTNTPRIFFDHYFTLYGWIVIIVSLRIPLPVLGMHGVRYHLILSKPESTVELFYMNLFNKFPLIRRMSKILQKRTSYIPRRRAGKSTLHLHPGGPFVV